jgi:leucyl-tRNA synthetase
MGKKYQPKEFEEKWQKVWEKEKIYQTPLLEEKDKKDKKYVLAMFPYPSGAGLHVGHVRIYTGTDVLARFFRMQGFKVLHPMGWDAFGLPAENAAIKAKKNPMDLVPRNIENFKRQMKMLGFSYDWNKEFSTTYSSYYQWTQWLFIQFFKMGLLYKKEMPIYYCPSCKTGLAEEEVLPNNTHERCGKEVERRTLPQWVFKITAYAERLLEDLKDLDWPEGILQMQKNWIGMSEGAEIKFKIDENKFIKVFTTRPDTLYGVTALVVAPEHWLIEEIKNQKFKIENKKLKEILEYVEQAKKKMDLVRTDLAKEKTGVDTTLKAIHPLTSEKIPIWVADYVLGWYGEGAVMVVPAHDERDYQFAKKFNLPIKVVVVSEKNSKLKSQNSKLQRKTKNMEKAFTEYGVLVNSGEFSGLSSEEAIKKITEKLKKLGLGKKAVAYKLRDWIFSRQRYWGEPIPMIYCESCAKKGITYWQSKLYRNEIKEKGELNQKETPEKKTENKNLSGWFPLEEKDLPLKLPYVSSYEPTETGESPLSKIESFVKTTCPNCGGPAKRETDTMPNWAGSCWYFLAFPLWNKGTESQNFLLSKLASPPKSVGSVSSRSSSLNEVSLRRSLAQTSTQRENFDFLIKNFGHWLPVDWYLGGAEHAVLHLLYSRFWVKALYDLGLLSFKEPFLRLRNVGMVLAEDNRKMSKSFGNVINPDDVVSEYGADALRLYEMFMAPFSQEIAWSTKALQGCYRFLKRVWEIYQSQYQKVSSKYQEDKSLVSKLNKTIKKVTDDVSQIKFNTAIAAMMEFVNEWGKRMKNEKIENKNLPSESEGDNEKLKNGQIKNIPLSKENAKKFLQILAPFAPFLTEEIWREVFGEKTSIHLSSWPKAKVVEDEEVVIPIQVNGKLRGTIKVKIKEAKDKRNIEKEALKDEKIKKYLEGKKV